MYVLIITFSLLLASCLTSTDTIHKTEFVTDTLTVSGGADTVYLTETDTLAIPGNTVYVVDTSIIYVDRSDGAILLPPDTVILTQVLTKYVDIIVTVRDTVTVAVHDTVILIEQVFDSTKMYEFFGEATAALCMDSLDNDNDGAIDCLDSDCSGTLPCVTYYEGTHDLCSNGMDDDNDGLIDCEDRDCDGVIVCAGQSL